MAEFDAIMPDLFPTGLRVFAVDDDSVALRTLELMLLKCEYKVTVSDHALQALELLRANKDEYDIVIIDIKMRDMDGFKLLEIVGIEMNLPVIMLSDDYDYKSVMKCIKYGAVDYLVQPVRLEELKLIWKHVAKRFLNEKKGVNQKILQLTKKFNDRVSEKDEDDNVDSEDKLTSQKKARISWTPELHSKFINAINQLGIDRAVPKKILDVMKIPGLNRENVASHLQKYKKCMKSSVIGLNQHDDVGTSGYNRSYLPMNVSNSSTNIYKNKSKFSSYFPGQQSGNGYDLVPRTWFPPHIRHINNFCQQHMMNSLGSQLTTHQLGLTTSSFMMNKSTQLPSCQFFNSSLNQPNFQAECSQNPWTNDEYVEPNSILQPGSTTDQEATDMFINNYNLDKNNNCSELNALFTFENEHDQFSSFSSTDIEIGTQINMDLVDVESYNFEDHI